MGLLEPDAGYGGGAEQDDVSMAPKLIIRVREDEAAARLARTIKGLAPDLSCRGCGRRDFALIEQPKSGFRSGFFRRGPREHQALSDRDIFHPVATLICTHCGHIEQFSDGVLQRIAEPEEYGDDVDDEGLWR